MSRSKMKVRRQAKVSIGEGASERELRDVVDQIIRQYAARWLFCFTCGASRLFTQLYPGHFISRKVLALRWHKNNIRAQCDFCNELHNRNPTIYRQMLVAEVGESEVCELEQIAEVNPHIDYSDLLTIREGLKAELARLKL